MVSDITPRTSSKVRSEVICKFNDVHDGFVEPLTYGAEKFLSQVLVLRLFDGRKLPLLRRNMTCWMLDMWKLDICEEL